MTPNQVAIDIADEAIELARLKSKVDVFEIMLHVPRFVRDYLDDAAALSIPVKAECLLRSVVERYPALGLPEARVEVMLELMRIDFDDKRYQVEDVIDGLERLEL